MLSLFDWLMARLENAVTENGGVRVEGNGGDADDGRTADGSGVADGRGMAHGTQQNPNHNQSLSRYQNRNQMTGSVFAAVTAGMGGEGGSEARGGARGRGRVDKGEGGGVRARTGVSAVRRGVSTSTWQRRERSDDDGEEMDAAEACMVPDVGGEQGNESW